MHQESDTLEDLARQLQDSNHEAYREIFVQMHDPLLRYTCRITGDKALAKDVVQDVFMKLWEKRNQIEVRSSLKAMLYTMARNRAFNVNRNRARMTYDTELVSDEFHFVVDGRIEETYDAMQLKDYIRAWVRELPPRRAEAFVLSRYHALSNREIGDIMGLTKRTVDTHIVHALRFLRARYEKLQQTGVKL